MSDVRLGIPAFDLHPLHGLHDPTSSTPAREPGSLRRTSSIDMVRAPGSLDPLYLHGHARDLETKLDGSATERTTASLEATIDTAARVVTQIEVCPDVPELRLVGVPAMSGFRAAADRAAPELRRHRDLRYTLLDDVPVAILISGHAISAARIKDHPTQSGYLPVADQCAGFLTGGLLMSSFEAGDAAVVTGPPAPDLTGIDPIGWHPMDALPLHGMRRRRRVDVTLDSGGREVTIDGMFRDTYVRSDNLETVIHEYTLEAHVDRLTGVVLSSRATPRVLPWQECPGAVASAARIVGMRLDDLHTRVRHELSGISTCTHLNDLLRSVADASALIALLDDK